MRAGRRSRIDGGAECGSSGVETRWVVCSWCLGHGPRCDRSGPWQPAPRRRDQSGHRHRSDQWRQLYLHRPGHQQSGSGPPSTPSLPVTPHSLSSLNATGSSFAIVAMQLWVGATGSLFGLDINWQVTSSVIGLNTFALNQVDFAASDIPYSSDQAEETPNQPYQYLPDVAAGLAFMYNLNGKNGPEDHQPDPRPRGHRQDLAGQDHHLERPVDRHPQPAARRRPPRDTDHSGLPVRRRGGELPPVGVPHQPGREHVRRCPEHLLAAGPRAAQRHLADPRPRASTSPPTRTTRDGRPAHQSARTVRTARPTTSHQSRAMEPSPTWRTPMPSCTTSRWPRWSTPAGRRYSRPRPT